MNQLEIFIDIKSELETLIDARLGAEMNDRLPHGCNVWMAASLLQKAIRRGENSWALMAAQHLLLRDPDRFWRRILIIAFEDIGVANLGLIARIMAAVKFRREYEKRGCASVLGLALAEQLVKSPKCRAADNLFVTIENTPPTAHRALERLNSAPLPDHMQTILNNAEDIVHRGISMWLAFGTQKHQISHTLTIRRGSPKATFDMLADEGWPHSLIETCRAAYSKTGETICPYVALLQSVHAHEAGSASNALPIAEPELIAQSPIIKRFGIPAYAIDYFTREGRRAYYKLLGTDCETVKVMNAHIPPGQQVEVLGSLVFRCESGLVNRRYNWPTGDELRLRADRSVARMFGADSDIIFDVMRRDLPLLNKIRGV